VSLGVSIFLLVVGAILTFAVDVTTSGFNLNTVGVILMVAGPLAWCCRCCFGAAFRRIGGAGPWPAPKRWSRSGASSVISPNAGQNCRDWCPRGLSTRAAGRRRLGALVGPVWSPPTRALIHA
jgi:hypothetical protein